MSAPEFPELPRPEERPRWLEALLAEIATLREENHRLREENQALRDEVARLKGQKGKPSIGPSRLTGKDRKDNPGKRVRRGGCQRRIDRTQVIKAKDVPSGSRFKGYADYVVQELVTKAETTQYRVEKWLTPAGEIVTGELPAEVGDGHFGATLRSFILYQYYHCQVTEPLILEQLREWGVTMSAGRAASSTVDSLKVIGCQQGGFSRRCPFISSPNPGPGGVFDDGAI
jgi:hypothetical protein